MDNILYVVSNLNMQTVELVASCLSKRYKDGFKKIILFETQESEKYEYDQIKIYRKYFKEFEKTAILLNDDGSIPNEKLYSVLDIKGNKVIDLSNGPKVTTSSLYLASTLCKVEDVYCLIFHNKPTENMSEGIDYDYLKLKQIQGIQRLAKLSYFDLIYYTEDVQLLISEEDRKRSNALNSIYEGMMVGIKGFFSGELDARSVINNLTIGNEMIIKSFHQYLKNNPVALECSKQNDIDLNRKGDPIGVLSYFCKAYIKSGSDMKLICLCTVPGLLSGLRDYRNISAHYASNHIILTDDNARTVINMQIEVLKCLHENIELWKEL